MAVKSTKATKPSKAQILKDKNRAIEEENMRLKKELAQKTTEANSKTGAFGKTWRAIAIVILAGLAGGLLLICNTLFWGAHTVVDSEQYGKVTSSLIKDPEIQQAVSIYTTNRIFENNDVEGTIASVLPPKADFLAPTLTTRLKSFTQATISKVLGNEKFQDTWSKVNVKAHDDLLKLANSPQGQDGVINLNEIYQQLSASLVDTKLSFLANKQLPAKVGEITVLKSDKLKTLHLVSSNINTFKYVSLGLILAFGAGAVWLSRNRRKMVMVFSAMFAILMLVTLVGLRIVTAIVVSKVLPDYQAAVRNAAGIIFNPLVIQSVSILFLSLVVLIGTFLSGPSKAATSVRDRIQLLFQGKAHKALFAKENRITLWVGKTKRALRVFGLLLLTVLMLRVQLTPARILVFAGLALVILALIELLASDSKAKR
jgi:hypothetical protein